ncbi:hypothetical protein [Halosimplex salinum]|uniref:hypothetical protein n=1 Tax=Halosimplex salinum TaxID=1710538 RepID=UPI0019D17EF6|nr:hypothetical protein [Halosimplex salinum]
MIDKVDPDMKYHGKKGEIIDIDFDDAGSVTGNPEDNFSYTVKLENGEIPDIHFRRQDLKLVKGSELN